MEVAGSACTALMTWRVGQVRCEVRDSAEGASAGLHVKTKHGVALFPLRSPHGAMAYTQDNDKLFLTDAQHEQSVRSRHLSLSRDCLRSLLWADGESDSSRLSPRSAIRAARAQALADRGAPIQLSTKPIRVVVRRNAVRGGEPEAWVAESGFVIRRIGLEVRSSTRSRVGESAS